MPIVSISITDELLKEMNNLEKSEGFSGRSDLIRAGIRELINLKQELGVVSTKNPEERLDYGKYPVGKKL